MFKRKKIHILSIEYDLSQKLDLEAVASYNSYLAIANGISSVKSNRRIAVNCMTCMLTKQQLLNLFYYMKRLVKNILMTYS